MHIFLRTEGISHQIQFKFDENTTFEILTTSFHHSTTSLSNISNMTDHVLPHFQTCRYLSRVFGVQYCYIFLRVGSYFKRACRTSQKTKYKLVRIYSDTTHQTPNERFIVQLLQSINLSAKEGGFDSFGSRVLTCQAGFLL